jgi:hypothetical protein
VKKESLELIKSALLKFFHRGFELGEFALSDIDIVEKMDEEFYENLDRLEEMLIKIEGEITK